MKKNSRLLRELKSFGFWLLGGMLVGLFGGIILRILTYLRFDFMTINWWWLLKIGIYSLLALVLSTNLVTGLMMLKIKKELPLLKKSSSDDNDERECKLNIRLSHVIIWQNISMVILLSILCLSTLYAWNKVYWLLGLDLLLIVLVVLSQVYAVKLYNKLRGTNVSALQDKKSLMDNGMQMNEGELQAEKETAYEIFITLSTSLIPTLYVIIFFMSAFTQTSPILAVSVLTIIYLYINIAQFKTVRNFFK